MRRNIIFAALCGLAAVVGLALFLWSLPPSCRVMVNTVAVTNDMAGTRYATFRVANAGRHTVTVAPSFLLHNTTGQWRTNLIPPESVTLGTNLMAASNPTNRNASTLWRAIPIGTNLWGALPFHPRSKLLAVHESFEVTLPLPFDDRRWRASFWYIEIRPPLNYALHDLFTKLFKSIGFTSSQNQTPLASTDWQTR